MRCVSQSSSSNNGVKNEPVQPYLIEPKMNELLSWYQVAVENIITKLAKFHIEFESIHPFIRWKRQNWKTLSQPELMKEGYPQ